MEQSIIFRIAAAVVTGMSLCGLVIRYFASGSSAAKLNLWPIRVDLRTFKALVYLAAICSTVVLMLTGFYAVIVTGKALTGYLLMLHATAAPVFAASFAISALFLTHQNSFAQDSFKGSKIYFWAMLTISLAVILSSTLSMFPIFGTDGQEFLYYLHRYSTILFTNVAIWYVYLAVCGRKEN